MDSTMHRGERFVDQGQLNGDTVSPSFALLLPSVNPALLQVLAAYPENR